MKDHPILFSTSMAKAILAGRKTMTRRIIKPQPIDNIEVDGNFYEGNYKGYVKVDNHPNWQQQFAYEFCPYGEVGSTLWVRETWQKVDTYPEPDCFGKYLYKSMGDTCDKWKPSIFMPKDACRIFLKITDIKVERVQDISEEDAIKEGVESWCDAIDNFKQLWQSINGEESWNSNPWCWCISFERTESPAAQLAKETLTVTEK